MWYYPLIKCLLHNCLVEQNGLLELILQIRLFLIFCQNNISHLCIAILNMQIWFLYNKYANQ